MWSVIYGAFFKTGNGGLVEFGSTEIGQQQQRTARFGGHIAGDQTAEFSHFIRRAIRKINEQDLSVLVCDKTYSLFHDRLREDARKGPAVAGPCDHKRYIFISFISFCAGDELPELGAPVLDP